MFAVFLGWCYSASVILSIALPEACTEHLRAHSFVNGLWQCSAVANGFGALGDAGESTGRFLVVQGKNSFPPKYPQVKSSRTKSILPFCLNHLLGPQLQTLNPISGGQMRCPQLSRTSQCNAMPSVSQPPSQLVQRLPNGHVPRNC